MITKITLRNLAAQSFKVAGNASEQSLAFNECKKHEKGFLRLAQMSLATPKSAEEFRALIRSHYADVTTRVDDRSTAKRISLVAYVPFAMIYFDTERNKE